MMLKESRMMSFINDWIEYLNDPMLVVRFQRYFGVDLNNYEKNKNRTSSSSSSRFTIDKRKKRANLSEVMNHENEHFNCTKAGSKNEDDDEKRKRLEFLENGDDSTSSGVSSEYPKDSSGRGKSSDRNYHGEEDGNGSSSSCSSSPYSKHDGLKNQNENMVNLVVQNKFWYYLFQFGTSLGDEMFYACFFSFWFWNVDSFVIRRVILVWTIVMYIGQSLKDIIRWPRPNSPPVFRLEKKWELEYGMPSTHAIVGAGVPFSIIIFTASRYEYPVGIGIIVALIWCSLVCTSRIYLGMHSVLDIIAGLGLIGILFIWVIPLVDWLDPILLKHDLGIFLLFSGTILLAICSPGGDRWTPARGDTIVILGSCTGLLSGSILNYQLGIMRGNPPLDLPYPVIWPSYRMLGLSLLRLILGLCVVIATRAIVKTAAYATIRTLVHSKEISYITNATKKEVLVELTYKFISYTAIGFNVVYLAPAVFRYIGIERPTFHTEI